jgi:peptide deformylase
MNSPSLETPPVVLSRVLSLVAPDSPILRTPCRAVRDSEMPELRDPKFLYRVDKFRRQQKGVGLAAPQLGDSRAWFVWSRHGHDGIGELVINPRVTFYLGQTELLHEGCLSFPGRTVLVARPVEIEVEFVDALGAQRTNRLHYLNARIFLHEYDHLQGTCIL